MENNLKARIAATEDAVRASADSALANRISTLEASGGREVMYRMPNSQEIEWAQQATFAPAEIVKPTLFGKILGIAKKAVANPLVQQAVTAAVLGKLNKVIKGK